MTGSANGATSCSEIPTVYGIPPWGFHTGPYTGASSFAKGHGNINLAANTVSGIMCQQDRAGVIVMSVAHHLVYHSHYAMMWGYPGNIIKIKFRVTRSTDPNAPSAPSVARLSTPATTAAQRQRPVLLPGCLQGPGPPDHGTEVNNQVPPL